MILLPEVVHACNLSTRQIQIGEMLRSAWPTYSVQGQPELEREGMPYTTTNTQPKRVPDSNT